MGFEGAPIENKDSDIENDSRAYNIANKIQIKLMEVMCKPRDTKQEQNAEFVKWAEHYGPSFRVIFNEVLSRDPDFLNKWEGDSLEQDNAVEFFTDELRKLDGPSVQAA